jgi:hypothetical protein
METTDEIMNPSISGYILYCFKKLRSVSLQELIKPPHICDPSLSFYLYYIHKVAKKSHTLLDLPEITKQVQQYLECFVYYSITGVYEYEKKLSQIFDYVLVIKPDDIVSTYQIALRDISSVALLNRYCTKQDVLSLLPSDLDEFQVLEIGGLSC